jgi:thiamine pyrophosphokinase
MLDATTRISLISAPGPAGRPIVRSLPGRAGDVVSLLPLGEGVEGVTTHGLRYPLADEPLPPGPARGLSNVRTQPDATVTVRRGLLLVVESPATLAR